MKFSLLVATVILFSCGSSNSDTTLVKNENAAASRSNVEGDGIIGEWEQEHTIFDKNGDNQLDEQERANPSQTKIGDYYLQFKPDGTCLYTNLHLEAEYDITTEGGRQVIHIKAGDPRTFEVLSVNKNEMVVKPRGAPGTFYVYKRVS